MKKLTVILSILIALCMLCSSTVFAESAAPAEPDTAVLDVDSIEPQDLAGQDDYILTDNGKPVLVVNHKEVLGATAALSDVVENGYYTADFTIPGTTKQVFLTGLTHDNIAEIEEAIIDSYAEGYDFRLEDMGFIDTEKTYDEDDDDNLCWAASTSNILTYTGWAAQAGFNSEDDLFEAFISSFGNAGSHAYYGLGWFFNGTDEPRFLDDPSSTHAELLDYPNSGGYLKDYTFDTFTDSYDLWYDGAAGCGKLLKQLKEGYGAVMSLDIYRYGAAQAGHAVTCWGFITDSSYPEDAKEHYEGIFITDSDSDEIVGERRNATDAMDLFTLTSIEQGNVDTYSFYLGSGNTGVIDGVTTLRSYTPDLPKETSAAATRDRTRNPDLLISDVALNSDSSDTESFVTEYPVGSDVYFFPNFPNNSDVDFSGRFVMKYTLTDSNGIEVTSRTIPAGNLTVGSYTTLFFRDPFLLASDMSAGIYTLTIEVNPNRTVAEAYYFNNTYSIDFTVGENYVIGDVDNDEEVSSVDATIILRLLAQFTMNLDERANIRGDINSDGELDIIDSTYIQRWLAQMPTVFNIGETDFYRS